jgi:hypothetical protein
MVQHKVGRVLNGDAEYFDSFVDVGGYAKLVADRQEKDQGPKKPAILTTATRTTGGKRQ